MGLRLVLGLGNPGPRYARTRHNVGFRLAERLAGPGAVWKDYEGGLGRYHRSEAFLVAEPLTFMNESGRFAQSLARFFKIAPEEMLVCFDDVALPLGRLRLRTAGSAGGQKGMKSIIDCLGTDKIPRLRLGVGPQPDFMDSADFVLAKFTADEEAKLEAVLSSAQDAVRLAAQEGVEAAMNRFNPAEPAA